MEKQEKNKHLDLKCEESLTTAEQGQNFRQV